MDCVEPDVCWKKELISGGKRFNISSRRVFNNLFFCGY
jgi:hypothetical protein